MGIVLLDGLPWEVEDCYKCGKQMHGADFKNNPGTTEYHIHCCDRGASTSDMHISVTVVNWNELQRALKRTIGAHPNKMESLDINRVLERAEMKIDD